MGHPPWAGCRFALPAVGYRTCQASGSAISLATGSGSSPADQIGERDVSPTRPQVGPDRDPDVAQVLGRARVVGGFRGRVLNVGERALHGPDHVGEGDLLRLAGEPVASPGAAPGAHQARVLELEQDVLQELQRDVLGFGELLALDRLLVGRGRQLERGAHRVVGFCGDPHFVTMAP